MRPVFPAVWLSARGVGGLLGLALVLALTSVAPALDVAVAVLAVAFGALLVADAALGPRRSALRVERLPLGPVALRRPGQVTYVVENRGRVRVRLGILETPVPAIAFAADAVELRVAGGARGQRELAFEARERGSASFGALYVWSENVLGLVRRRYRVEAAETVRVFPDLRAVGATGTLARRTTLALAGFRRVRARGAGSEFESLRDYEPGDGFGLVDWKATARRGRLTVAQHQLERSQTVLIALDCGRLMTPRVGAQRKFDYALTAALSVARVARDAGDNVGLVAFAARPILEIAPRRGAAQHAALAQAAYDLQPRLEEPDYETTFVALRRHYPKRSLIVLFSDVFDPVTSAALLAGLTALAPRHLVLCVLMNDAALADALGAPPATVRAAYRSAVAMTLADERARSLATLRARGILVVDVPAPQLTVALLDAYLDVKARGRL